MLGRTWCISDLIALLVYLKLNGRRYGTQLVLGFVCLSFLNGSTIMIDTIYQWLVVQITTNDVFAGVLGGGVFMTVIMSLKSLPIRLWSLVQRQYTVSLKVYNSSEPFSWIQSWLALHTTLATKTLRLQLQAALHAATPSDPNDDEPEDKKPKWLISPASGWHFFMHKGRPFWLEHTITEPEGVEKVRESITLRTIGRNRKPLIDIIEAARGQLDTLEKLDVKVWQHSYWNALPGRALRSLDSVILPEPLKSGIVSDMEWFLRSEDWYKDRGIPYHRGYLLTGPPRHR